MKKWINLLVLAAIFGNAFAFPKSFESLIKNSCPGTICPQGCCPEPGYVCCKDNMHCAEAEEDCPTRKTSGSLIAQLSEGSLKDCEGQMCDGKCCPVAGWVCCTDGAYCATDLASCPDHPKVAQLISMATKRVSPKDCEGQMCDGKCCPVAGWVCCTDGAYCATDLASCPDHPKVAQLISMATKRVSPKDCEGQMCDGKCCPMAGWACCTDGAYCATDLASCPDHPKKDQLLKLASTIPKQDCPGVICDGGCCAKPGFVCCPDGIYCASVIELCPPTRKINRLIGMATKNTEAKCVGPICPGGCCPHENYICCPNNKHCASSVDKCPDLRTNIARVLELAPKSSQQRCDGPICPGGCCPHEGYICCPNNKHCADSLDNCPARVSHPLLKFAPRRNRECPGTECEGGCCPQAGWYCCPDKENCAQELEYCPQL